MLSQPKGVLVMLLLLVVVPMGSVTNALEAFREAQRGEHQLRRRFANRIRSVLAGGVSSEQREDTYTPTTSAPTTPAPTSCACPNLPNCEISFSSGSCGAGYTVPCWVCYFFNGWGYSTQKGQCTYRVDSSRAMRTYSLLASPLPFSSDSDNLFDFESCHGPIA